MLDPLREHAAYLEMLKAVRDHLSLVNTALYLGSKPQNVAGWIAAHSVPTLKDFRARLVEAAFFLKYIVERPLDLGPNALHILDLTPPQMPPWGLVYAVERPTQPETEEPPVSERPLGSLAHRFVNNVMELLPPPPGSNNEMRRPSLSWQKLTLLRQICEEDRPKRAKPDSGKAKPATIVIWGEACAGKSTLANALLGAEIFATSPTPEPPRLKVLTSPDKVLVEAPAFDYPPPPVEDSLQLLRYLLNTDDCSLFLVLSSAAYPVLARLAFLEQIAQLPCKLNIVFSKMDVYKGSEQEQVSRFLRGRFVAHRVYLCGDFYRDDVMITELRSAAGLVGTARFKMVASVSDHRDADLGGQTLTAITVLVRRVANLGDVSLTEATSFKQLLLTEPQIGAILLAIEQDFHMKFPDRDADFALRGDGTLRWLAEIVATLKQG